jgi:hypothetical protein
MLISGVIIIDGNIIQILLIQALLKQMQVHIDLEIIIQVLHLFTTQTQVEKYLTIGIALIMLIYGDEQQIHMRLGDDLVQSDFIYQAQQTVLL